MEKKANTEYPIHELLANRWSPRSFNSEKEISLEVINSLFEAARWAPSSYNMQPWSFIYGKRDEATFNKINEILTPFNQLWAPKSSMLVLVTGNSLSPDGSLNSAYAYDCGTAVANLTFEASSRGLYVHQMGGFDIQKASETFNLPNHIKPIVVIAVGFIDEASKLHENLVDMEKSPRNRKPISEFVFN